MYTRGRGSNAISRSSSTREKAKENKRKAKGKERGRKGGKKEVGKKLHPVHTDNAAARQAGCQQCKPMGESDRPTRCWPRCA